jgi:hypothetical protein
MQTSVFYVTPVLAVIGAATLAGSYLGTVSRNSISSEGERAPLLDPGSVLLDPNDKEAAPHRVQLSPDQWRTVTDVVKDQLFDPNSAEFYPYRISALGYKDGRQLFEICGAVNAKNRFGGYTGKEAFVLVAWPGSYPLVQLGEAAEASCFSLIGKLRDFTYKTP